MTKKHTLFILFNFLLLVACESAQEKTNRLKLEEQARKELEAERIEQQERLQAEQNRIEQERIKAEEVERKAQELYNRYINNSLANGATPYSTCFGGNQPCTEWGCSEIKVQGPPNSDVLVTIKSGNRVIRHAYIRAGYSYTFQLPNGEYQPFSYYGKGWNPEKEMPSEICENLKGGFIADSQVGKDDPQTLNNDVLSYSLILQQSGNFSTRPSSESEAF
ncbi:MAG: hypothetical protein ACK4SF_13810 [Algoriphagus aquaeductus]|uniref:hypothetical protein n=1 Tax=Algoriphagus aquaeductus TaxID=475299 RepID=UPI00391CEB90